MSYEFSIGSFFIGLIIVIISILFLRFHQVIADNLGMGVSSYDRYKLYGFIACGLGFLVTLNLHWFILGNLLQAIFHTN